MAYNLLLWELTAIFAPEVIKVDIFDLLCKRGSLLQAFVSPCGFVNN